jgi:hypothetical protein
LHSFIRGKKLKKKKLKKNWVSGPLGRSNKGLLLAQILAQSKREKNYEKMTKRKIYDT